MESDVILAHELVQLNIISRVKPPFFPLIVIVCRNRYVPNRSIEPHIEHFLFKFFKWYWGAPLQVTGNAATDQTLVAKLFCKRNRI